MARGDSLAEDGDESGMAAWPLSKYPNRPTDHSAGGATACNKEERTPVKTIAKFALPLMLVAGMLSATTSAANAANPRCITKAEFRAIHKGQSPTRVKHIVGSRGKVSITSSISGYKSVIRDFHACSPFNKYSMVSVSFSNNSAYGPLRVDGKTALWMHN